MGGERLGDDSDRVGGHSTISSTSSSAPLLSLFIMAVNNVMVSSVSINRMLKGVRKTWLHEKKTSFSFPFFTTLSFISSKEIEMQRDE